MSTFAGEFMVLTSTPEGTTGNNAVAVFNDLNLGDTTSSFTASIDWGDGSPPTAGTVTSIGGFFTVSGSHAYADEGSPQVSVTLTRTADQDTATASGSVTVTENDFLFGFGTTITRNLNQAFSGAVAFFVDGSPAGMAGDFTASIDWGDGQTTTGTVTTNGFGTFTVSGAHTYTAAGQDIVKVTFADDPPGTESATATTTVNIRSLSGQMLLNSATEGTMVGNAVATFSDTDLSDGASNFSATINWGDGVTTAGFVGGSAGSLTVSGGHTYADEGNDAASVTLTHTDDGLQVTASGNVAVAEGDVLTPHGTTITSHANQAFSGFVATFSDSIQSFTSDFAAQIDWGDGQTTSGTVFTSGFGSFTVMGAHTYSVSGQDTVKVTLADDAPGTATATATTTATVARGSIPFDLNGDSNSDLVFQNNGQAGVWLMNGTTPIAEAGLGNPGASWHIVTSRDVNGDGNADLIWQNSDGTPGIWLMNGTTPIAEAGFSNPGTSWHIKAAGDLNGDGNADLVWQNSDGTLGVWLMNGTTPATAAAIGNPGANWKVVGTADYNADGRDDILLQNTTTGNLMIDLMNGTSITSTVSITVGDPSWHAVSTGVFNGQAEIAWQNSDGTPGVWVMNGTAPVAEAALPNPGAAWQVLSIDHFTADRQGDLLFQNTNGAIGMWEMNGTNIVAAVGLLNAGSGWQSVNGHPFTSG